MLLRINLMRYFVNTPAISTSYGFHTSSVNNARYKRFRAEYGMKINPNTFSPLTNLPDYTYMDGRPTPLGIRQFTRVERQRVLTQKIITGIKEVDFAKERYQKMLQQAEADKRSIIDNKLKPKGSLLLNKKPK